jgi:hypothetical protein
MRRFALLFIFSAMFSTFVYAQDDLRLDWDAALNTVTGTVALSGTANIPNQQIYFVEAAPYDPANLETDQWTPVVLPQFAPVVDAALGTGTWDTTKFTDGLYQLRVHAVNQNNDSLFYTVGPIAVNNGGAIANTEQVAVLNMPSATASTEPATGGDVLVIDGVEMVGSPDVENRLPIPVGGHVRHFTDDTKALMRDTGMTWVKWQVPYHEGSDLVVARDRINWSHEAGFKVLLSITGEKDALAVGGDAYLDAYAEFLGQVAAAGADAIEVWNEMNIDREWPTGQIDPSFYARMLQKAHTAIKASNPDTMVITGALAPTGAESAFGLASVWNDDRYYLGMANAGVANYADCIGAHYNEGILPPNAQGGDPRGEYPTRYLPLMLQRISYPFRAFDIPMCMTEMGYLSPEGYGPLPDSFNWAVNVSVQEQSEWLAQAITISSQYVEMPVELIIVWNVDFDNYENDPQAGYAILRPDGTCPTCQTIAALQE